MKKIFEAKKQFSEMYRNQEGFVGVGIGKQGTKDTIRVYVKSAGTPLVTSLNGQNKFQGFPIEIQTIGVVEPLSVKKM
jgi:hypothetical protein